MSYEEKILEQFIRNKKARDALASDTPVQRKKYGTLIKEVLEASQQVHEAKPEIIKIGQLRLNHRVLCKRYGIGAVIKIEGGTVHVFWVYSNTVTRLNQKDIDELGIFLERRGWR